MGKFSLNVFFKTQSLYFIGNFLLSSALSLVRRETDYPPYLIRFYSAGLSSYLASPFIFLLPTSKNHHGRTREQIWRGEGESAARAPDRPACQREGAVTQGSRRRRRREVIHPVVALPFPMVSCRFAFSFFQFVHWLVLSSSLFLPVYQFHVNQFKFAILLDLGMIFIACKVVFVVIDAFFIANWARVHCDCIAFLV